MMSVTWWVGCDALPRHEGPSANDEEGQRTFEGHRPCACSRVRNPGNGQGADWNGKWPPPELEPPRALQQGRRHLVGRWTLHPEPVPSFGRRPTQRAPPGRAASGATRLALAPGAPLPVAFTRCPSLGSRPCMLTARLATAELRAWIACGCAAGASSCASGAAGIAAAQGPRSLGISTLLLELATPWQAVPSEARVGCAALLR
mmetsp:Transcript_107312/g.346295  ORF Transcript_107312/g.346295 Transcript_107312/m.346295 type:complete len:203 (-) Transcript_107312:1266-1874(-)